MKRILTKPGVIRWNVSYIFLVLPWLTILAQTSHTLPADYTISSVTHRIPQEGQLNTLTVNFSMMSPHVGQDLWLAVIDTESMREVGRVHAVVELSFVLQIPEILEDGKSYHVDFFADLNMNGYYDPPGTDHAWRIEINDVLGDETIEFSHQIAFTDVEWKHRLRLAFSGISESIGQEIVLYVRELATGNYLDTVILETIPDDEFTMDSYVVSPGGTYMLDFFIDFNGNGMYDAPPVDHAWRLETGETVGDMDLEFTHNQDFTDIFQASGVAPELESFRISVYPNPATSFLNISMEPGQSNNGTISILSLSGTMVLSRTFLGSGTSMDLEIGQLPEGIYILQVESNSRRSLSRFIKQ